MRIGLVGAGSVGQAIARLLVEDGHSVHALARRDSTEAQLAAAGVRPCRSVSETGRFADVVIVCVFDDDQLREVISGDGGLLSCMSTGSVIASHTTGSPATVRALARIARDHGIGVVDAGFSGGTEDVAERRLALYVGGESDALSRALPVLAAYGDPVVLTGGVGTGMVAKLLNNALFAAHAQLAALTLAAGPELGVSTHSLAAAINAGSGASRAFEGFAGWDPEAYAAAVRRYVAKDFALVRALAADHGVDLGPLEHVIGEGPLDLTNPTGTPLADARTRSSALGESHPTESHTGTHSSFVVE